MTDLFFVNPNDYITDLDRQCVSDCDNAPKSEDEAWWGQCIDQCIKNSPGTRNNIQGLIREVNGESWQEGDDLP